MDNTLQDGTNSRIDSFTLKSNFFLLSLFFLQATVIYGVMNYYGLTEHFIPTLYSGIIYVGLAMYLIFNFFSFKPGNFEKKWLNANIVINVMVPTICIPILISLFSSMKSVLHILNPFYLDSVLMQLDQVIQFGFHPWQITHYFFWW